MRFALAANTSAPPNDCTYVRLYKTVALTTANGFAVALDVWLGDEVGDGAYTFEPPLFVAWSSSGTGCTFVLEPSGSLREQIDGASTVEHAFNATPKRGGWSRYSLDVDFSLGGALSLEIDATKQSLTNDHTRPVCARAPSTVMFGVGFFCAASHATKAEMRIDNVVFTTR